MVYMSQLEHRTHSLLFSECHCSNHHLLQKDVSLMSTRRRINLWFTDKNVEGIVSLCPFSILIVLSFPLGPMT